MIAALFGLTVLASSAQAQQAIYPTPTLQPTFSIQGGVVVSGHSFVASWHASIKCTRLTETWNGQSASAAGSTVTHRFTAPIVTHNTVIPMHVTCTYTNVSGAAGAALSVAQSSISRTANITVVPVATHGGGKLPNTGGPSIGWFIGGAAAVILGGFAVLFGLRRRGDGVAH